MARGMDPEPEAFTSLDLALIAMDRDGALTSEAIAHRLLDHAGHRLSPKDCATLVEVLWGSAGLADALDVMRGAGYRLPAQDDAHGACLLRLAKRVVDGVVTPRAVAHLMLAHAIRMGSERYYLLLDNVICQEDDAVSNRPGQPKEQVLAEFWEWASPLGR